MILKVLHANPGAVFPEGGPRKGEAAPHIEAHYFDNVRRFSTRPCELTPEDLPEEFFGLYHDSGASGDRRGYALLTLFREDGRALDLTHVVYVPGWAYAMNDQGRTIERL